ncbi:MULTISPECIES: hypothetical protein [Streptomyces]|uniref:hypothetical protein n=1 Tax=Streptomyces TaxID=1883 RepID=UPI000A471EA5|nr:hypothetical protein [Streptomyces griseolus]
MARCREESIEPPTAGRCDRIVGAAPQEAEESLTALTCPQASYIGRRPAAAG